MSNIMHTPKSTYNGWKNYQTWNVALWIGNDEGLYKEARWFMSEPEFFKDNINSYGEYKSFIMYLRENHGLIETPDEVAYNDSSLDYERLNEMLKEDYGPENFN